MFWAAKKFERRGLHAVSKKSNTSKINILDQIGRLFNVLLMKNKHVNDTLVIIQSWITTS